MQKYLVSAFFFFLFVSNSFLSAQITYKGAVKTQNKNAIQMITSPDNKFAYVLTTSEIQIYIRNQSTGQMTFYSSHSSMSGSVSLYNVSTLAMSPDSKFIYIEGSNNFFVFSRDIITGGLTPFQTISTSPVMTPGTSPLSNNNIVCSNDLKNVYITGRTNLSIFNRDPITGNLSLSDTLRNLNNGTFSSFDVSIVLSDDNQLAFITGGSSVSVYLRDSLTGGLQFKSIISATNFVNQGLAYDRESVLSNDNRYLYTVSNSMGSGALTVISINPVTDSLKIIQTITNTIRPQFINISPDGRLICLSSGIGSIVNDMLFFEADSSTGKVHLVAQFQGSSKYYGKKFIDKTNQYFYSCNAFTDSVFIYRFKLFLDESIDLCIGDTVTLKPIGNYVSYSWSNGSSASTIHTSSPGTYTLTATDQYGFSYTNSAYVSPRPLPVLSLGNDTTLYFGQSVYLSPNGNYQSYLWNMNNNTSYNQYLINNSSFIGTKMIVLTVTNVFDCKNSDTILVTFAPNGINEPLGGYGDFSIYPNPIISHAVIHTDIFLKNASLVVENTNGQKMKIINNIQGNEFIVYREDFPPGTYLFRIMEGNTLFGVKTLIVAD